MRYENDRPIYLQVIEDISRRLIQGELALGEKLPSVREMAVQYQINPNTASRVYKEMESRGLCYTKRGMGTFITEDSGMIKMLQSEMAEDCLDTFLQGMQAIGIGLDEMIQLLREVCKGGVMMLDCVNVVKRYGGKFAVNGMSVAIEDAHIYGLLGPNGSGKSTWMKMAAGLIVPDEGQMTLDGVKIGAETKRHIAYMPTEGYFYSYMKIKDVGRYYQDFFDDFDEQQFEKLIADMDLEMNMKVRNLSSGMMAKLKIAVTLSRKAELYLLDEPLNGIDLLARDEVVNTILTNMSDNASVVISSHLVEELERIIDKAIFMKDGQIVLMGDVEEIRQERGESVTDLYRQIYG